jgi:hypothetical protein
MRYRSSFGLAILPGLVLLWAPAWAGTTTGEILENISANEKLYDNIEVKFEIEYKVITLPYAYPPNLIETSSTPTWVVRQGDRLFYEISRRYRTRENREDLDKITSCYDGARSCAVREGVEANLSDRCIKDDRAYYTNPFLIFVASHYVTMPLSNYLRGGRYLEEDRRLKDKEVAVTYDGDDTVAGLACHRLRVVQWRRGEEKPKDQFGIIWIAPDRNYLPIKSEWYYLGAGRSFPAVTGAAEDLREIKPGIWHPYRYTFKSYDIDHFMHNKKYVLKHTRIYSYEKVQLDPDYPADFFRSVKIPDGLPVYVIEDGKQVDSYIQGRPHRVKPTANRRWIYLLGASIGFVAVGTTAAARWRSKRAQRRGPSGIEDPMDPSAA